MADQSRPISPDTPMTSCEMNLPRARKPNPRADGRADYENGAHVRPPSGETCKCGSRRVYRISDPDNPYRSALHCFDCWRRW